MALVLRSVKGSNLTPTEVDDNFVGLDSRLAALEDHPPVAVEIDFFSITGNQLLIHMTDHSIKGPLTLPTATMRLTNPPTGLWEPSTPYQNLDLFNINGSTYLVVFPHTSGLTFDAGANDGLGHNFYSLMFTNPADVIPAGGSIGQFLTKVDGHDFNTQWSTEFRRLSIYISGSPAASERLLRYETPEIITLPGGLVGSRASAAIPTTAPTSFNLQQNGVTIGSIDFFSSPAEAAFTFISDVTFQVGDILEIFAPGTIDTTQADISITLQAHL